MTRAILGLGSNLGDREQALREALSALARMPDLTLIQRSCLYESEPVGRTDQPWFVNCVAEIETTLSPVALLEVCLSLETARGRVRTADNRWGPRTLDIDLLFYGELSLQTDQLTLPHPRLHERAFVLVPLLEIAPDWRHPTLGQTVEALHLALENPEEVRIFAESAG
jgi:2-amino-4-hydroxy-6-hydroxymethyldihydropteridine diphosphokinase